jgi:hypothetical protein
VYGATSESETEEEIPSEEDFVKAECNDFILFQYLGIWIFLNPLAPLGVLGGNFGEPSLEVSHRHCIPFVKVTTRTPPLTSSQRR